MVNIKPISKKAYTTKQSLSDFMPKLSARIIISGPSGTGKGVLVASLLLNPQLYRDCFAKIYYFSGSATLDHSLEPLKDYAHSQLGMSQEEDPCLRDGWSEAEVSKILANQRKVVLAAKRRGTELPAICIVCDDLADNKKAMHGSMLQSLFTRGRHSNVTIILMTQRYRLLDVTTRVNANALFIFRMRNAKDLEAIVEENSALADKDTLLRVYDQATREKYGFLYVDLMQSDPNLMFFKNLTARLLPGKNLL